MTTIVECKKSPNSQKRHYANTKRVQYQIKGPKRFSPRKMLYNSNGNGNETNPICGVPQTPDVFHILLRFTKNIDIFYTLFTLLEKNN